MSNTKELTVDVRGSLCPKPVIETKKVSDANPSVIITTIVDNEVSRDNVVREVSWLWCRSSPIWQGFLSYYDTKCKSGNGSKL